MSDTFTNPYQPEGYRPGGPPGKAIGRMEYMRSVNYIFENPNWLQNILFVAICFLIPLVGPLVLYGYQFEIVEALHLRRGGAYPDFDFNRFADYLLRGLWVFLVTIVLVIMVYAVIGLVMLVAWAVVGGLAAVGGEDALAIGMMIVVPVGFLFIFVFSILFNLFMVPFVLRAGLTQDFGASFDFRFAKQFVANTWAQMIVAGLFTMAAVLILEVLGVLMMCVGLFFTLAIAQLMLPHLLFQLYEVHLARGGDAIPLAPAKPM
jgi:hypothetical protein